MARPGIAPATCTVAKFCDNLGQASWKAIMKILQICHAPKTYCRGHVWWRANGVEYIYGRDISVRIRGPRQQLRGQYKGGVGKRAIMLTEG